MLRISTVVDGGVGVVLIQPLEVLRISTVVDTRDEFSHERGPLEVLRISTVVDLLVFLPQRCLWKC